MTKNELEASRIKTASRLNEISALEGDAFTDAIRAEAGTLETEYRDSGVKLQAALAVEDAERATAEREAAELGSLAGDAETRERNALRAKASIANYLRCGLEMRASAGPEAELNAALKMGADAFPLELLAPPEIRATTDVDAGPTVPRPWLDRLFNESAAMHLGVSFESVAPGVASFPSTTAGAAGAQRGRAEAAADGAWTVAVTEMKPARAAVRVVFAQQDVARIGPGLEDALRRDLQMALLDAIDKTIFTGDAGANEAAGDIVGLQTAANVAESTLTQAKKLLGADILAMFAGFLDGKHAAGLSDLKIVASVGSNVLWLTTAQSAVENQTVAQFLKASGLAWTSRGGIDVATAADDFGAYIGLARGIAGAAVAPIWENAMLIRDPYSDSKGGTVSLTLSTLWNFGVVRGANFKRAKYVA